jgi:hypothetical protein
MGMVRIATVALLIIAIPVLADSVVSYQLQLGGLNSANYIKAGTRIPYMSGSAADGQAFAAGVLNWAASIAVSGNHSQPGHPSDGLPTQGVANFVFNLELHQGTEAGPLVSNVSFYSTIHDGTGALPCTDCAGGYTIPGPTPFCAGSAFTYVFDISSLDWGPGTVLEALLSGVYTGPFMEVGMYPTVDVNNTSGHGQLLGVGAGYGRWSRGDPDGSIRTTKGVGIPTAQGGLGVLPVVEGQINTGSLAVGTYVLKLVPGTGHNVLRGDVDLVSAPPSGQPQDEVQAFAVPANSTVGDTITFEIADLPSMALTAVESVKTHGTAGTFGIECYTAANQGECRSNGVTQIVATFNRPVYCVGESCDPTDVELLSNNGYSPSVTSVSVQVNKVTVIVSGATNPDQMYVSFSGIRDSENNTLYDIPCIRILPGDTNNNGSVNAFDINVVRASLAQAVSASTFRKDVNVSGGTINAFDLNYVRARLGQSVDVCPF